MRQASPWLCFLCTMYSEETHGLLLPRPHWNENLVHFFNPTTLVNIKDQTEPVPMVGPRKRLRVLSLCDGIGTSLLALTRLGLEVEAYFSCEVDPGAVRIVQFNHSNLITNLGDVYNLDREQLERLLPLDLIICSLPCGDCSLLHDPDTGGFNGHGMMALKLLTILKELSVLQNANTQPYWLLETPANMAAVIKTSISMILQTEASMWDSGWFSPYHRPTLYWGNLPGLNRAMEYADRPDEDFELQTCLVKKLNRVARVTKMRNCVLTSKGLTNEKEDLTLVTMPIPETGTVESIENEAGDQELTEPDFSGGRKDMEKSDLSEGREDVVKEDDGERMTVRSNLNSSGCNFVMPVIMEGKPTNMCLGLPDHYTDISKMSMEERLRLAHGRVSDTFAGLKVSDDERPRVHLSGARTRPPADRWTGDVIQSQQRIPYVLKALTKNIASVRWIVNKYVRRRRQTILKHSKNKQQLSHLLP
ncbi:DNM3A-like protein [Mya arenaria]|uniref:DNA (cytosine-5-)-methyltransferase n=1 Tax=Mya arenaria TaxID=6604 RepID=A0ABY7E9S7_MYAAR|nr:DNM3A-like protein [Mya arenaria]